MTKNIGVPHVALLALCAGLAACSGLGQSEKALNEQAAWATAVGVKNRPQATAAQAGPDGVVRLTGGTLSAAGPAAAVAAVPVPPVAAAAAPAPPVAQAAAVAAPQAQTQAALDADRQAILASVLDWRKAWVGGDAPTYISHYEATFKGDQPSRAAWEKQRRERLSGRSIAVRIDNLSARVTGDMAEVEFTQRYISNKHEDVGVKTMVLLRTAGKWLIVEEKWRKA